MQRRSGPRARNHALALHMPRPGRRRTVFAIVITAGVVCRELIGRSSELAFLLQRVRGGAGSARR